MCDYCDCRSQPEIAQLSTEHERIGEILGKLRREGPRDLDRHLDELDAVVGPHSRREEAGLYAQMRNAGIDSDRFAHEHQQIDDAFLAARTQPHLLGAAIELLTQHIFEEETDLFPATRQMLGPTEWAAIDRAVDALFAAGTGSGPRAHQPPDGGTR